MMHFLERFFRPRVTINHSKVKKVDYDAAYRQTTLRLCAETGKPYPLRIHFDDLVVVTIADGEGR